MNSSLPSHHRVQFFVEGKPQVEENAEQNSDLHLDGYLGLDFKIH